MPFTIDFLDDGRVLEWERTTDGPVSTVREDYTPRFYVANQADDSDLTELQACYDRHPHVEATEFVDRRTGFRRSPERVLAIDVAHIEQIKPLARQARQFSSNPVGDLACYNVDLSREFRYCVDTDLGADNTRTQRAARGDWQ